MNENEDSPIDITQVDPRYFQRTDDSADALFYTQPRKVVHIDQGAIDEVTDLYRTLLPNNGSILDLMSSWRSHLPPEVSYQRVCGLGMNEEEMADNPQLTDSVVHNLNESPQLPFATDEFDGVCCCVSVQYMQRPVEVFTEVARVLKSGGPFIVTFSNRCFPTKAIHLWRATDDTGHLQVVEGYFAAVAQFGPAQTQIHLPSMIDTEHQNPLYAVWGYLFKEKPL